MSPLAILWLLLSTGALGVDDAQAAAKATAPTPAVEIVLAGTPESRAKMEAAIRAVAGSEVDLGWSRLDSLPKDLFSSNGRGVAPGPRVSRIWLDLGDPAQVRVYMPTAEPQGALIVRSIGRPDGDAEDGDRVAREEVAQIVKTALLALQGKPKPDEPPLADQAPQASDPPPLAAEVVASADEPPPERSRRVSFFLGGGFHTQPWDLSNDIGQKDGLGLTLLGAGRWSIRSWQLGLRLTWEKSAIDGFRYNISSDLYAGTLAAAYRFQWRWLALSLGMQAGLLVVRQTISLSSTPVDDGFNRPTDAWAAGPLAGPVLEMDFALSRRLFLHLDAALPASFLRIDDGLTRRWDGSAYVQTTLGLGFWL